MEMAENEVEEKQEELNVVSQESRTCGILISIISRAKACVYDAAEYFVAWQGVLTIAYCGIPASILQICQELEKLNPSKEPLKSPLFNGKWKLIFTTSDSILKKSRPGLLRPIYQAINTDTLGAQNMETWPYFNQVTANLVPIDSRKVLVKFDYFKIFGLSIISTGREMGVAGRFPQHISKSLSSVELCARSHTSIGNAGPVKVSDLDGFECEDWKKPCDFLEKIQPVYSDKPDLKWCGLCGNREGWMRCGSCMGEGGYVTKPGLAGVKGRVGWSRCKTCFGKKILPCLLCGLKKDDRQPK